MSIKQNEEYREQKEAKKRGRPKKEIVRVELTPEIIYGFTHGFLLSRYDNPKPIPEFHRELWYYCTLPDKCVALSAPRGHAKSTAITHAYCLAELLFRSSSFVVIVSDTETQAIQFLNDIKAELLENDDIKDLFQVKRFVKENEKDIIVEVGDDKHRFRVMVRGSNQSVRGLKWRNKRPDLILGDDLENDEIVMNEDRRAKFRQWFFGALLPCLSDNGKIRIVGTILHFDSLLERLMPPLTGPKAKYTKTLGLRQYSVDPKRTWTSIKYRAHTDFDDFSEILWPEKFNETRLKGIRQDYLDQGIPESYAQEYLNYPIAEQNAFFRKQDLLPMEKADYASHGTYYIACDLAISQREKADFSAFVVGKLDYNNRLHILDVIRGRMDAKELIDIIFDLQIRYQPDLFIFEDGQITKSLGPFLHDEMFRKNIFIPIHKETPTRDKVQRARAIQGRMRQGGVRFNKQGDFWLDFEQEVLRFDKGEHDDQVDAMAYLGLVLNRMVQGKSTEELDDEEYENMKYRDSLAENWYSSGRSGVTGY